jgi:hypothetical protein
MIASIASVSPAGVPKIFPACAFISTPEDTILQKLRWARDAGGSARQWRDAMSVYELQRAHLDRAYLHRWAEQLGLSENLARLEREAEPL